MCLLDILVQYNRNASGVYDHASVLCSVTFLFSRMLLAVRPTAVQIVVKVCSHRIILQRTGDLRVVSDFD
jgi:hypothetical protein